MEEKPGDNRQPLNYWAFHAIDKANCLRSLWKITLSSTESCIYHTVENVLKQHLELYFQDMTKITIRKCFRGKWFLLVMLLCLLQCNFEFKSAFNASLLVIYFNIIQRHNSGTRRRGTCDSILHFIRYPTLKRLWFC